MSSPKTVYVIVAGLALAFIVTIGGFVLAGGAAPPNEAPANSLGPVR